MKHLLTLGIITLFFACTPVDNDKNSETKVAPEKPKLNLDQLVTSSPVLESVLLIPDGDFRGLDIGDPIDQVNDVTSALVMEDQKYKHYQIDISDYEFFDLIYYNFEGKLDEIEAEVYMEKDDDSYPIYADLEKFFTAKYGKPMFGYNGEYIWNKVNPDSSVVAYQLKYVSTFPEVGKEVIEKKIEIGIKLVN